MWLLFGVATSFLCYYYNYPESPFVLTGFNPFFTPPFYYYYNYYYRTISIAPS